MFFILAAFVIATQGWATHREFTRKDHRVGFVFIAILDIQILLGLLLYFFLSPITQTAFQSMGAAMKNSTLRYFSIEHITAMAIAFSIAHIGRVSVRRAKDDLIKHRRTSISIGLVLLSILIGIPWPFFPYARPLIRNKLPVLISGTNPVQKIFQQRCATCHGVFGQGDGPAAMGLKPRPRDFRDPAWQQSITDKAIEQIIIKGGLGVGKSSAMPENLDLAERPEDVAALRAYIRSFAP